MIRIFPFLLALVFCLYSRPVSAGPLAVGDTVPTFSAQDQFGKDFSTTNGYAFLLVATEMGCAKAANQKLAALGAGYLEKNRAAYLLDIHTMPAIGRFFALPKMRKYPQHIVLVETAGTLTAFPARSECITVLAITTAGRIRSISYWDPARDPAPVFLP